MSSLERRLAVVTDAVANLNAERMNRLRERVRNADLSA